MIEKIFSITEDESGVPIDAKCVGELVRCKDCRWWQDDFMGTWCCRLSSVRITNADDFCSHGERREDGEEE